MQKMMMIILFCSLIYSVSSTEPQDNKPFLHVMAKSSVYNTGEQKAIYCTGFLLSEKMQWMSPSNTVVEYKSSHNTRVYVEPERKNETHHLMPLIIKSTKIEDSGTWTCKSGDFNETIDILVGEKVIFPERNEYIEVEEGKSYKIPCVAKGSPAPVVQWYKDVTLIPDDLKKYIKLTKNHNYQLEIKNLNHLDSGEYVCKVTQEALSHYTDKRIRLAVQHKPLIVNTDTQEVYSSKYKTQEVYAIVNETKNITCSVLAHPPPTYHWYRRFVNYDELIPADDTVFTSEDGAYSVLMLRLYNESYLGEYKCSANNTKGQVSIVFHVSSGNKPNPPDYVALVAANTTELTFNVSCSTCKMSSEEGLAPQPEDLKILGYSFQLVPVREGYNIADWDAAEEFLVNIDDPDDIAFTVGPLANSTTYYARVRTRNEAGFSEWVDISPNPTTTSVAIKLSGSIGLLFISLITSLHYLLK